MIGDINYWAVGVATVAAFVAAFGYYVVLGSKLKEYGSKGVEGDKPPAWLVPVELGKHLVLALVTAGLVVGIDITNIGGGLLLGLVLWIAFPVVVLVSSVLHEKVPWRLAALHAGDWLIKLALIGAVLGLWR